MTVVTAEDVSHLTLGGIGRQPLDVEGARGIVRKREAHVVDRRRLPSRKREEEAAMNSDGVGGRQEVAVERMRRDEERTRAAGVRAGSIGSSVRVGRAVGRAERRWRVLGGGAVTRAEAG